MRTPSLILAVSLGIATVSASVDAPDDMGQRAKAAKKVVLATVMDVQSAFGENDAGDDLILSRITVRVDETMKGTHEMTMIVTLEGGTVGDVSLDVSDMPRMEKGGRAVLFLTTSAKGEWIPYDRGTGLLTIDADDRVTGTGLTIGDIRAAVKAAQREKN
jgi:hypothetical protein